MLARLLTPYKSLSLSNQLVLPQLSLTSLCLLVRSPRTLVRSSSSTTNVRIGSIVMHYADNTCLAIPKKPVLEERNSSFTEEERQSAMQIRKNVLKSQGRSLWNVSHATADLFLVYRHRFVHHCAHFFCCVYFSAQQIASGHHHR